MKKNVVESVILMPESRKKYYLLVVKKGISFIEAKIIGLALNFFFSFWAHIELQFIDHFSRLLILEITFRSLKYLNPFWISRDISKYFKTIEFVVRTIVKQNNLNSKLHQYKYMFQQNGFIFHLPYFFDESYFWVYFDLQSENYFGS